MSSSILTTHVGSLPRSKELSELLFAKDKKENFNQETFNKVVQKNAMLTWEKKCDFKDILNKDKAVSKYLSFKELDELF